MMRENAESLFEKFLKASTCKETLQTFQLLCSEVQIPYPPLRNAAYDHITFYTRLKEILGNYWKAQSLFAKLDKKFNDDVNFEIRKGSRERNRAARDFNVLIVGAGPCGLRMAIFTALLGAKTVVVEKRDSFSRNNVLHLWPFTIEDLKALGAKKFNGRFCSGAIDHVSIRQLQLILMKAALIFGVEIHVNTAFSDVIAPNVEGASTWKADIEPDSSPVSNFDFHMIVGADGRKNTLKGFVKKEFRGSLAIGITVNFINKKTSAEARVSEISGINFIYRQEFFRELNRLHNIDLENIVYYKDDTHYFVMTARKQSLLERGVFKECLDEARLLVHNDNIDQSALLQYALDAVNFSTENKLPDLEVAINHYGLPDIALFDFTCMKSSINASMFRESNGAKLLQALVGDGLIEPFWPKGTGIAKGFLAAYDTAWMLRQWALGKSQQKSSDNSLELSLLAEREGQYRILPQTESSNLVQKYSLFSIDPKTRYQSVPSKTALERIKSFYLTDGKETELLSVPTDSVDSSIVPRGLTRNVSFVKSNKLQQWCERVLRDSGSNLSVTDMSSSWRDGYALCTIISYYRPDILDLGQLEEGNIEYNNQLAFDIAEEHLGITPIMSGKEMADCDAVDDLLMVTYLSQFYEILKNEEPVKPIKRVSDIISTPPDESLPPKMKKKSPLGLLVRISHQFKRKSVQRGASKEYEVDRKEDSKRRKVFSKNDSSVAQTNSQVILTKATLPPIIDEDKENTVVMREKSKDSPTPGVRKNTSNRISALSAQLISKLEQNADVPVQNPITHKVMKNQASNVCYFCGKTVYIVERLSVEGLFFHRECFKCTHCQVSLRPMNYKRDMDSGKFYCSVHYFANAEYLKSGEKSSKTVSKLEEPISQQSSIVTSPEIHVEDTEETDVLAMGDYSPIRPDKLNLSVPTIENGQVVMRRDLTPKRGDMVAMALSLSPTTNNKVEEEFLYKHNMRCSLNSDNESDSYSSESDADELYELANQSMGLDDHSAQEILTKYHSKANATNRSTEETTRNTDGSALLSSESEGDEDVSSLSSSSADEARACESRMNEGGIESVPSCGEKKVVARSERTKHFSKQRTMSSSSSDEDEETTALQPVNKSLILKQRTLSSSSSEAENEMQSANIKDQKTDDNGRPESTGVVVRRDTIEEASQYIKDNPIRRRSLSSSSSSTSNGEEELVLELVEDENEISPHILERDGTNGMSSESESEADLIGETSVGTDFRASPHVLESANDTSIWASNIDSVENSNNKRVEKAYEPEIQQVVVEDVIMSDAIMPSPNGNSLPDVVADGPKNDLPVSSTPKQSYPLSDNEIFYTPSADGTKNDSFYTVKSDQSSSRNISFDLGSHDTTVTSDTVDGSSMISDSSLSVSPMSSSGRKLPETPKGTGRRRLLPVVPKIQHLEALSPTGNVSPRQRERIEMKLKKHEDRVMERIKKMKLGCSEGKNDQSPSNDANISKEKEAAERDDFVNHVPILLQKRNNALLKKKHKRSKGGGENKKGLFTFAQKKKPNKEKEAVSAPRVMSPTNRSSRRRNISSYTREELDERVSHRVRIAAQRQAKEAERKRMARALVIQGQLQEVDERRTQLEERGVKLEKLLRDEKRQGTRQRESSLHMHEWFKLVQEKNALLRYENELMIHQRELQLEDRQSRLQQELRERMAMDDTKKSSDELAKEKEILTEMMEVVEQRDQLVALLDEHRVQGKEENADIEQVLMQKFLENTAVSI